MLLIESKRKKRENILKKYPDAIIADVTSHAEDDLIKLSPFYPHGGIPVPWCAGSSWLHHGCPWRKGHPCS